MTHQENKLWEKWVAERERADRLQRDLDNKEKAHEVWRKAQSVELHQWMTRAQEAERDVRLMMLEITSLFPDCSWKTPLEAWLHLKNAVGNIRAERNMLTEQLGYPADHLWLRSDCECRRCSAQRDEVTEGGSI